MKKNFKSFITQLFLNMFSGSKKYHLWLSALAGLMLIGFHFYCRQLAASFRSEYQHTLVDIVLFVQLVSKGLEGFS